MLSTLKGYAAAAAVALLLTMAGVTYWSWERAEDARATAQIEKARADEAAKKVDDWSRAYRSLLEQSAMADKALAAAQAATAARAQTLKVDTAHLRAELGRIADACAAAAVPAAVDEFLRDSARSAAGAGSGDGKDPASPPVRLREAVLGRRELD